MFLIESAISRLFGFHKALRPSQAFNKSKRWQNEAEQWLCRFRFVLVGN